jgi:hypothetical protein
MAFNRERLSDPIAYYQGKGLTLMGSHHASWRITRCHFHSVSDSMRIKVVSGAFRCMACEARGGDLLAYHMAVHGVDFVEAAKAIGAWTEDAQPALRYRPAQLSPRDALEILGFEATFTAVAAANMANRVPLSDKDHNRLMVAAWIKERIPSATTLPTTRESDHATGSDTSREAIK